MDIRSDFYVYILFRPNGVPCYVGKGRGRRWDAHESGYRSGRKSHNRHLTNIIAGAGSDLPKIKVRENLTKEEAFITEIALIAAIGRKGDGGPLVNKTAGGDGARGHTLSVEHKEKIRTSLKGIVRSEEFCVKIGNRRRGIKASAETLEKLRLSHTGHKQTLEQIEKIASKNRGKKRTEEFKERVSRLHKGKKRSPEFCKRMSEVAKARVASEETKEKRRLSLIQTYSSLETKRRHSEIMTLWWARRKSDKV